MAHTSVSYTLSTKQLSRLSYCTTVKYGISPNWPWRRLRDSTFAPHIRWPGSIHQRELSMEFGSIQRRRRSGRMQHGFHCQVYPGPLSDNRDVRGNGTDLYGLRWQQTAERVNATSVMVGAAAVLGRNQGCNWIQCE